MKTVKETALFLITAMTIVVGACSIFAQAQNDKDIFSILSLRESENFHSRCSEGFLISCEEYSNSEQYTRYNVPAYSSSESASYSTTALRLFNSLKHRTLQTLRLSLTTKSELLTKIPCRSLCMHLGAFPDRFSDKSSHFIALRRLVI